VSIMLAGSLTMLFATAALGIDAGTLFLEKRRLQGVADAAALAAAAEPLDARAAVRRAIDTNGSADTTGTTIDSVTPGIYAADAAIAFADRFTPGEDGANAVEVRLTSNAPTFFARIISGESSVPIAAKSTAARIDLAGFSLGTGIVAVEGGLANSLLSQLAGTDLSLSAIDYQALASTNVDLLQMTGALRASLDIGGASFVETLGTPLPLPQAVRALASATGNAQTAAILTAVADRLPNRIVRLADIIDLGPLGTEVSADPRRPISIDTLSTLRALIELGQEGHQITSDVTLGIPGLAATRVMAVVGARAEQSPWVTVGKAGEAVLHSAQTRVYVETRLLDILPLGLGSITLPVYVEMGAASARLTALSCQGGRARTRATIAVTPSVGSAAITRVDPAQLANLSRPIATAPAPIAASSLARVTAAADLPVGGATTIDVTFDADDIATHRHKSVSSGQLTQGLASALIDRTSVEARALGTGLTLPLIDQTTRTILFTAAQSLDLLIDQTLSIMGVRLGTADTWINGVRCGTPRLVG
jgi:uncharacterized membrane protein